MSTRTNKTIMYCFCKVCFDAGEPEDKYKSHFVRDKPGPDGKVICPLLLATKCRYCNEAGHTVKFCEKLKKQEKIQYKQEKLQREYAYKKEKDARPSNGMPSKKTAFEMLQDDFDDELEHQHQQIQEQ